MKTSKTLIELIQNTFFTSSALFFISSIIWIVTENELDYWFSRLMASLICLGFGTIIYLLKDKTKQ